MNKTTAAVVSLALSLSVLACSGSSPEPSAPASPMPDAGGAATPGATPVVLSTTPPSAPAPTETAPPPPVVASAAPVMTSAAPASATAPVLRLTQGKVTTAETDLAAADAKVRQCLAKSKGAGEVLVKITIATSGFALSATATPTGDVSKDAVKCARDAIRDHSFGKPVGGGVAAAEGTFKVSGS